MKKWQIFAAVVAVAFIALAITGACSLGGIECAAPSTNQVEGR